MRPRAEMLKDANRARRRYATLTKPEDMRIVRLAQDVTELLAALVERDETIRCLNIDLALRYDLADITFRAHNAELAEKDAEIEAWKLVASELNTAVSTKDNTIVYLREEIERLAGSRRSAWKEAERLRGEKRMWMTKESRLLARLNLRDVEIDRLKADLAQSQSATEKLSRGLWKDC